MTDAPQSLTLGVGWMRTPVGAEGVEDAEGACGEDPSDDVDVTGLAIGEMTLSVCDGGGGGGCG